MRSICIVAFTASSPSQDRPATRASEAPSATPMARPAATRASETRRCQGSSPERSRSHAVANTAPGAASVRAGITPAMLPACQSRTRASGTASRRRRGRRSLPGLFTGTGAAGEPGCLDWAETRFGQGLGPRPGMYRAWALRVRAARAPAGHGWTCRGGLGAGSVPVRKLPTRPVVGEATDAGHGGGPHSYQDVTQDLLSAGRRATATFTEVRPPGSRSSLGRQRAQNAMLRHRSLYGSTARNPPRLPSGQAPRPPAQVLARVSPAWRGAGRAARIGAGCPAPPSSPRTCLW